MKTEVAIRQPYPLPDGVFRVASSVSVGLSLLTPDCVSKVLMSLIPSLLAALYPIVNGWDIGWFPPPGEQRGLIPQDTLERGETRGRFPEGVLSIFCPHQITTPVQLIGTAI